MRIDFVSKNPGYRSYAEQLAERLGPAHRLRFVEPRALPLDAEAWVSAGNPAMPRELLARASTGFIQTLGTGYEHIDLAAAEALGIWVSNLRAGATGNADSVAELAILQMLALSRRFAEAQQALREGRWAQPTGAALLGKRALIVGLGDVGAAIAVRLVAFGMDVVATRAHPERGAPAGVQVLPHLALDAELGLADFVVIAARADASNAGMFDAARLGLMKRSAFLINVARGSLVKSDALVEALRSGGIAGAGLDVFETEPLDPAHPLLSMPGVVLTPHVAGVTDVNFTRSLEVIATNLERFARGERPAHLLTHPQTPRVHLQ